MFKVGDLVKLNASFSLDSHPPMGTLGIVTDVEQFENMVISMLLIRVHWSCGPNKDTQVYVDSNLKKVA